MWIVTACPDDPHKVSLKHLLYDVWLNPLWAENVVRNESQKNSISDGSVFKIKLENTEKFIYISDSLLSSATEASTSSLASLSNTSDYSSCFKIVMANSQTKLQNYAISHMSKFIRSYDEQAVRKVYDFTSRATFKMLSDVLKCMKRLCINSFPSVYNPMVQFKEPNEEVQRVSFSFILVIQRIKIN